MLLGWSSWSEQDISEFVASGGAVERVPGEFLVVEELGPRHVRFIASAVSAIPYFYTLLSDGRVVHGPDVFGVVERAGLPWVWNDDAVVDLALVGHTLGKQSLHRWVHRVAGCGVTDICHGDVDERSTSFWRDLEGASGGTMEQLLDVTRKVYAEQVGNRDNYLISVTAGYDSRLLLGLALERGDRPRCATMGPSWATDQVAARALCGANGLAHTAVTFTPDDYLAHAGTITQLASGSKTAANWHSYLYGVNGGFDSGALHIVGSNGEFARTFFADNRLWPTFERLPRASVSAYWTARCTRRRARFKTGWSVLPRAPRALIGQGVRMAGLAKAGRDPLAMLDTYYTTQRVRHFIGNGLRLMGQTSQIRSPFMDARWIRAAAALPRTMRVGNRWHLEAIRAIDPSLLDHPFNGFDIDPRTLAKTTQSPVLGYSAFDELCTSRQLMATLRGSQALNRFIPPAARAAALREGAKDDVELMLTLHEAAKLAATVATVPSRRQERVSRAPRHARPRASASLGL